MFLVNLFEIKFFLLPKISNYFPVYSRHQIPHEKMLAVEGVVHSIIVRKVFSHLTISMMVEVKARPNMM